MIILRDKLCCSIEDVLYRKQNARRSSGEQTEIVPKDIVDSILEFNKGDLLLYNIAWERLNCDIHGYTHLENHLEIFKYEMGKYDAMCEGIKEGKRYHVCPPTTNGQVGVFVENVRNEQRMKLMRKLKMKSKEMGSS